MPDSAQFLTAVYTRKPDVVFRDIAGEVVLVPIKGRLADLQRIFSLNPIAADIWRLLDGTRSVGEIRDAMVADYNVGNERAYEDLRAFLAALSEAELVSQA